MTVLPQHMEALGQANTIRLDRAKLKREIKAGNVTVASVILFPPPEAATMAIGDLLAAQHRWGRERAARFCRAVPMLESKTVGSFTDRQRVDVASRVLP